MLREEFVENIVIGDKLISVGLDDYGQSYFFEWAEDGVLQTSSCGTYNTDYKQEIEYVFGSPENDCQLYPKVIGAGLVPCKYKGKYGFCDKCKFGDVDWHCRNNLVQIGVIDRRGNVLEPYDKILMRREDEEIKDNDCTKT